MRKKADLDRVLLLVGHVVADDELRGDVELGDNLRGIAHFDLGADLTRVGLLDDALKEGKRKVERKFAEESQTGST